jgi:hypothetical protein
MMWWWAHSMPKRCLLGPNNVIPNNNVTPNKGTVLLFGVFCWRRFTGAKSAATWTHFLVPCRASSVRNASFAATPLEAAKEAGTAAELLELALGGRGAPPPPLPTALLPKGATLRHATLKAAEEGAPDIAAAAGGGRRAAGGGGCGGRRPLTH